MFLLANLLNSSQFSFSSSFLFVNYHCEHFVNYWIVEYSSDSFLDPCEKLSNDTILINWHIGMFTSQLQILCISCISYCHFSLLSSNSIISALRKLLRLSRHFIHEKNPMSLWSYAFKLKLFPYITYFIINFLSLLEFKTHPVFRVRNYDFSINLQILEIDYCNKITIPIF